MEDNLEIPAKQSEKIPAIPRKTVKRKPVPRKAAIPRIPTVPLGDNSATVQNKSTEAVVDPLKILSMGGGLPKEDEADEYSQMNVIEGEKSKANDQPFRSEFADLVTGKQMIIEEVEVPLVRKVAIKKINRFNFRLGMERTAEKFNLVPGTAHTWVCDKKGDHFMTGLEDNDELRTRLEKKLRVDLSSTSSYWANLSFSIEDKEHGQILNFDDTQLGPYYEVIYNAMLASSMIANGLHEHSTGIKPFAEWYIENKEAEAEVKQLNMSIEMEAQDYFQNTSLSKRSSIAKMLGLKVYGVSEKVASVELWEHVKKNAETARDFLKIARLRDDELNVSVLIKDAIKYNVIRKNGANDLTFAGETLGPTEAHLVSKLVNPSNADTRLAIQRQVQSKK